MSTVPASRLTESAAPLDVLLVDAALGPVRRFLPDLSTAKWALPLANARIMRALLPHATLHVYDDGHLGLLTDADKLGPLVSRFLTSQGADGASTCS
jgi:hypothetical protein